MARQLLFGRGLLMAETLRSHSYTLQSVGLLRATDQPEAETFT